METPHFRITFHEGTEGMARLTAIAAEEAYSWWADKLGYAPSGKTEVVIIDRQDGPNGFAMLVPNKQFVNFTAYARFAGGFANSESPSWEELVTFHEYGHIADLDYVSGLSLALRRLFGRAIMPGSQEPTLLVEGIPTYGEYKLRGASRANEARVAMMLRAMVLENAFPTYQEASFYYSRAKWPRVGSISHDVGPWFIRFLEDTYGEETYAQLKQTMAEDPWWALGSLLGVLTQLSLSGDFNSVFARVTGKAMPELWREFQGWLSDQFAEEIKNIEAEGITASRRLTPFGYSTGLSRWSPDGEWIYYVHSDPERTGGIRRIRSDGTGDAAVVSGSFADMAVSPDGSFLIYAKMDTYNKFYQRYDLYRYDLATGKERRLTWGERPFQLVITPDGGAVIYARYNWGEKTPSLSRLDLTTGDITPIQEFPEDVAIENIALSPDGKTLALSIWRRGGFSDIYTLPAAGGELTPITQDRATDYQPSFSPDGRYILFSSDRTGVYNLYAYDLTDGSLYRISNVLTGALGPMVSPDGTQIAFTGYSAVGYDIHLMGYEPNAWASVQYTKETLPGWEGFPEVDYEIHPYTPIPSLLPKLWMPLYDGSRVGVATFGRDALFAHSYEVSGGWDLDKSSPFVKLRYTFAGMLPTVSLSGSLSNSGHSVGVNLSYPLMRSRALSQTLSAGYRRSDFGKVAETFSASWRLSYSRGLDTSRMGLAFSLTGLWTRSEGSEPIRKLIASVRKEISLPFAGLQTLALRFAGGWSDASLPQMGFSIGGLEGLFALRGFGRGVQAGRVAVVGAMEYHFPLFSIERGLGLWPIFFDDLDGTVFFEAGQAGETLPENLEGLKVSFGVEGRLSLNLFSYFGGPTFIFGLAQGLGEPQPQLYMTMEAEF